MTIIIAAIIIIAGFVGLCQFINWLVWDYLYQRMK
jgi:CHASE2 domain-containing sensor protein